MIKLLRRMLIMGMVLVMCVSCMIPIAFAASAENSDSSSVIQVEFDEYISSKDNYTALLEEGYTLIIHIGEENEAAKLAELGMSPDTCQSQSMRTEYMPYGITIPTYEWNVATLGTRTIDGKRNDTLGYLFTNYIFTGCSVYETSIYNRSNSTLEAHFVEKGQTSAFTQFKVPAKSTAVNLVFKPSWYGRFKMPCDVYGQVFKYVMH